jgi:prolyl-tRNA editing enzyme YbaK/EbsC (Cys-tRNA(Pro) deacylase)
MPPFGHQHTLRTLVDTAVAAMDVIYGGGGDIDTMMRLTSQTLLAVTQAELVSLSE